MAVKEVLLLGNPRLYEISAPIVKEEIECIKTVVQDLHDTLLDFRNRYGAGRAIAAPQIGVAKRLLYMHIEKSSVFINPVIDLKSPEMMAVWDDCMSFPELLVRVNRHQRCRIRYRDLDWNEQSMTIEGDLSELLQHEYDHLDGILAVSKAIDQFSFALKSQKALWP
ncbi:MAG: peptide deformylase [Thermacetogeniaceae bacterium]